MSSQHFCTQHCRAVADVLWVTTARQVVSGTTYLITRRCTERMFLLGANDAANEVFKYCLAEAASRFGVLVHGAVVMSNHIHIVITDVRGELPRFAHLFFCQLAKATNARTGHTESVFGRSDRYSAVELVTEEAIVEALAYVVANPATAGLVENAGEWPGFITYPSDILHQRVYHAATGDNPYLQRREQAELHLSIVAPPTVVNVAEFAARVQREYKRLEASARALRRAKGLGVKGATAIQLEKWSAKPKRGAALFRLNPRIAAGEGATGARIASLIALKKFRADYREALRLFGSKAHQVEFPHGTSKMRVMFDVRVAAPPGLAA